MEEQPVALPQVTVQPVLLQMLEQRPAGAMQNALGLPGRAGGKKHEQRVVERKALPGAIVGRAAAFHEVGKPMDWTRHPVWSRPVVERDNGLQ